MKKNLNIINLIIASLFPLLISCETPAGHTGVSDDIADSKKRGVFVSEYMANPNPYRINDSLQITVKEAWLERRWRYGNSKDETLTFPPENYQLCINTIEEDIKNMSSKWTIGLDGDKYIRMSSLNSLMSDFQKMPGDTIEYQVQQGRQLNKIDKKIIIGKFMLIKKKN